MTKNKKQKIIINNNFNFGFIHLELKLFSNMTDVLVPFISAFLIIDADGDRIIAKYYNNKPKTEQIKFEALIQKKTKLIGLKSDGEQ